MCVLRHPFPLFLLPVEANYGFAKEYLSDRYPNIVAGDGKVNFGINGD